MEKEKPIHYHEIVRPLKEFGGMVLDLIVPKEAVEQGWMTEEEMECRIIDWVDTHRDI